MLRVWGARLHECRWRAWSSSSSSHACCRFRGWSSQPQKYRKPAIPTSSSPKRVGHLARPGVDGVEDGGVVCRRRRRRRRLLRPYRRRSRVLVVASAVLVNPCQHELLTRGMGTHLPAGWWVHHLPGRSTQPSSSSVVVVGCRWSTSSTFDVVGHRPAPSPSKSAVVGRPAPSSLDVDRPCSSTAVIETAWPISHCR